MFPFILPVQSIKYSKHSKIAIFFNPNCVNLIWFVNSHNQFFRIIVTGVGGMIVPPMYGGFPLPTTTPP